MANAQSVPTKFVVSGPAAREILDSTTINLETAERITMACERLARERGVSISVYVLDNDGNDVYIHRMDGEIKITIIATGFPTTESLLERDVENTMSSINRVQFDQDSLDLPPFLRRGSGNISGTPPAE